MRPAKAYQPYAMLAPTVFLLATFFLYPLFYLAKRLNQRRYSEDAAGDEKKIVATMIAGTQKSSSLMRLLMKMEQMLRPHIYLPFGVRCLVTARKPAGHSA